MSVINIEDIAHVRFSAPDLGVMRNFLNEFGMVCQDHADGRLYARGHDGRPFIHVTELGEPYFIGLGLRAQSVDDLHLLATAEGVAVEGCAMPGGGQVVRLMDPDGFAVEVVAGQTRSAPDFGPADIPVNTVHARARVGRLAPLDPRPSHVYRIAHCGLGVTDLRRSESWYKQKFGFLTSDEIEVAPGESAGAFLRCDLGARPVDHHTLVFGQYRKGARFLHAAFEVANLEDLMLGHAYLKVRERVHVWGVGRHILGSQIFDYWQDPWGRELEHWTDGDLLTAANPPGKASLSTSLVSQWGSSHPTMKIPREVKR